jgi:hypothetical protein
MAAADDDFAKTAAVLREGTLVPALKDQLREKTALRQRDRIYLNGGAAWALATLVRPQDRGSYVNLSSADIAAYHKLLMRTPGVSPTPDLSSIADADVRQAAQKEIDRVKKVFPPEQLLAGAEILKALDTAFDFGGNSKQLVFARNGYIGWILAYVVEKK